MVELGSNHPKTTNDDDSLRFNTVCHHKKNGNQNLSYMKSTKTFTCFSECSESFDIYEVVRRNKALHGIEMSFYDTVRFVAKISNKFFGKKRQVGFGTPNHIIDDWDFIDGYDTMQTQETIYTPIKDSFLDCYHKLYHQSWIDDGISIDTMKNFNIRYCVKDHQIIIPHYHSTDGRLIGIRGRNLMPEPLDKGQKYMPVYLQGKAFNHALGGNLYGMYRNRKAISRIRKIMIVESEKGVMQTNTMYGENNFTVATCSSNITNMQRDLIIDSNVDEVILAPDKDFELDSPEYERQMRSISRLAQKFVPYMRVYIIEDYDGLLAVNDSPTDRGQEVLEKLMQDKVELTMDIINEHTR